MLTAKTAQWGAVSTEILRLLTDYGPMTRSEICAHLGRDKEDVASCVSRLARKSPRAGKRIHVVDYVNDMEGERRYPRAVYALGDRHDKQKPAPDPLEVKRRYWARRKCRLTANSVFHLGMTRGQLDAYIKERTAG